MMSLALGTQAVGAVQGRAARSVPRPLCSASAFRSVARPQFFSQGRKAVLAQRSPAAQHVPLAAAVGMSGWTHCSKGLRPRSRSWRASAKGKRSASSDGEQSDDREPSGSESPERDSEDYFASPDEAGPRAMDGQDEFQDEGFDDQAGDGQRYIALRELLKEAGVESLRIDTNLPETEDLGIFGVSADSRTAQPDDLFVALKGKEFDGHNFIAEAVNAGVGALLVSEPVEDAEKYIADGVAIVTVADTRACVAALAATFYGHPSENMTTVGITGTNGKTTTAWLVRAILEAVGQDCGLIGTTGYELGETKFNANGTVWEKSQEILDTDETWAAQYLSPYGDRYSVKSTTPDAVQSQQIMSAMFDQGAAACVVEVSSSALAQGRTDRVDFDIAVFTNLSQDDMEGHGSFEEYRATKGRLFEALTDAARQRAVINLDDPESQFFVDRVGQGVPIITYSTKTPAEFEPGAPTPDIYPTVIDLSLFDSVLEISTPAGDLQVTSMLLGTPNVANVCAAVAVGCALGISLDVIAEGIQSLDNGVPGRLEMVDENQPFAVIVDYAHTPEALRRTLQTVRDCGAQRIVTIFGCGGDRDPSQRPLMGKIAHELSNTVIVTSDNPRWEDPHEILEDIAFGFEHDVYDSNEVRRKLFRFPFLKDFANFTGEDFWADDPWAAMQYQSAARRFVIRDRSYALRAGIMMAGEGDAVVIAGKGHEDFIEVEGEKFWFSDQAECRHLLKLLPKKPSTLETYNLPWRCKGWPTDMGDFMNG